MKECIFCKIITKKVESFIVFENDFTLAFLELFPSAPGHTIVISKKHGYSILDYDDNELGKIMGTSKKIANAIKKSLNCDSITIGINHFEEKGVPHLHIHLIPRWVNDNGGIIQSTVQNKTTHSKKEIAEKIKTLL